MTTAISIINQTNDMMSIAKIFASSGLFADTKEQAQAFVKILAGAEMGMPPFTAMNSFHIVKGRVTLTANAMAARIKASGKYDYVVIESSATNCEIQFMQNGKHVHTETWSAARARTAGTGNMDRFPEAMLFARCITSGGRKVAPDVIGQYYAAEEMGATIDSEGALTAADSVIENKPEPVRVIEPSTGEVMPPAAPTEPKRIETAVKPVESVINKREVAKERIAKYGKALEPHKTDENVKTRLIYARAAYTNERASIDELFKQGDNLKALVKSYTAAQPMPEAMAIPAVDQSKSGAYA